MYAVIESGGQQHKVQVNATVTVDRLAVPAGAAVRFDRVYLIGSESGACVGAPTVAEAVVRGRVVRHLRGPKIRGFKYKPKKRFRRRFGHRSELTQVLIEAIETGAATDLEEEEPTAAAVAMEEPEVEATAAETDEEAEEAEATDEEATDTEEGNEATGDASGW